MGGGPTAYSSKTVYDIEMEFDEVVQYHKLTDLV